MIIYNIEKYKPISKVVYAVPADDHPCDAGNIPGSRVEVGVGVAVAVVEDLVLGDDHGLPGIGTGVVHQGAGGVTLVHHPDNKMV